MMTLRFRWVTQGGHVHVRVFAGCSNIYGVNTLGKAGDLVFRTDEWDALMAGLQADAGSDLVVEFRPEEEIDVRMPPLSTT